jgi:MFS family permease
MSSSSEPVSRPWYKVLSNYQWTVLIVASLGWIFDVFEGQIFVASMREAMPSLLPEDLPANELSGLANFWNNAALGFFLFGGAVGGVLFGAMSDRIGRSRTMIITILFYSIFTSLSAFAQTPWQMVGLRFLVALGVGGEWAVASAMIAEVMPNRVRPITSSIFHASSVFGTLLAAAAGAFVVGNPELGENAWRWGFALGALPAALTIWIRLKLKEPDQWVKMQERSKEEPKIKPGSIPDLFKGRQLRSTLVGVSLSSIGLVTFWGVHIYGKNALLEHARGEALAADGLSASAPAALVNQTLEKPQNKAAMKRAEMLSMALNTLGGGLGLVLFGWISTKLGRKGAFLFYHIGAFAVAWLMFNVLIERAQSPPILLMGMLPVFGFFTLGMHAGYAVYFPEIYPTHLRGLGSGFCFNMGRVATGFCILLIGWLQRPAEQGGYEWSIIQTANYLSWLYLAGIFIVLFARETNEQDLLE